MASPSPDEPAGFLDSTAEFLDNQVTPLSVAEVRRLRALQSYLVLDTPPEQNYQEIVALARALCATPIAMVSLLSLDRQWPKACIGGESLELPRDEAFCSRMIQTPGEMLIVPDARLDPRFAENPIVRERGICFYAGAPLVTVEGEVLGAVCVLDKVPRTLTDDQLAGLRSLAAHTMAFLEQRLLLQSQSKLLQELSVAQLDAREADDRFQRAVSAMHDGLLVFEPRYGIVLCNPSAERILGAPERDLLGRTLAEAHWQARRDDDKPFLAHELPHLVTLREGTPQTNILMGLVRPDGEEVWVLINAAPLFHPGESHPHAAVLTFEDITDRRHFEKITQQQLVEFNRLNRQLELRQRELAQANLQLEALATIDGLTGLKNHRKFQEELLAQFRMSLRYQQALSLILLDVDSFKSYNDTFGHPAGDEVLRTIADVLLRATRVTDCAARYGGEEFAIVLPHTSAEDSLVVAERCRRVIAELPWPRRAITISVGVATLRPGARDPKELIQEADQALYHSKHNGKNQVTHGSDLNLEARKAA